MQVPGPFEYERATGVEHAIALLDRLGEEARVVAGGHSLLPMMKLRLANPEYLIDINDLDELAYLEIEPESVRIGALTRHRVLLESDDLAAVFPIFRDAEEVIADPVVRNRGTIGGSLCQADPAEDLSTVCSVLDAVCVVRGPSGVRELPFAEFHLGPYETAVAPNELLVEIRLPRKGPCSSAYAKVERRAGDWAVAAVGAAVWIADGVFSDARIGLTAVRADDDALAAIGDLLHGSAPTEELFRDAGALASAACSPESDQRGTAEYKRHLASELTVRTLRRAAERLDLLEGNRHR
ncbi:MAG: xanthine dehydrogenase family protein subunit M [Rhodococcus sp.]|uniref:FAD binding domain-containing protein n=1 Tax=unclassified Rhodococcus (in: high G+C Gram-positive bacteria) TaxID=192944 RepID=UPI00146EC755|nr:MULTISPECIES: xanthine dehydrogenase family protein subunit M [unclassified Rhodococcus (in: high G+C Gram-positive bacteria)]MCK0092359.1 xanthine dehydrogenase family protein subunit M [Rhodococcus sp. F64268]NLE81935.1 xanthine dehydrogenase family protein subunit M [Rhodococcus sp. (in: high G+C Gram-positive bacteria)]NLU63106.1 xanthine dehydrogenase family protein subunit M [Rhodococcus sp. HNM0563]